MGEGVELESPVLPGIRTDPTAVLAVAGVSKRVEAMAGEEMVKEARLDERRIDDDKGPLVHGFCLGKGLVELGGEVLVGVDGDHRVSGSGLEIVQQLELVAPPFVGAHVPAALFPEIKPAGPFRLVQVPADEQPADLRGLGRRCVGKSNRNDLAEWASGMLNICCKDPSLLILQGFVST